MPVSTLLTCGSCQAANIPGAQFCESCGQPQFEACSGCNASVRIGQTFCNHCGCDLKSKIEERVQRCELILQQAEESARKGDYADAYLTVRRIAKPTDYRFAKLAKRAAEAAERYGKFRDNMEGQVTELLPQATHALKQRRYGETLRLVEGIPEQSMPRELLAVVNRCRESEAERQSLIQLLSIWLKERKLVEAASSVERLLHLDADVNKWEMWSKKVGVELIKDAMVHQQQGRFGPALKMLDAVPTQARTDEYKKQYLGLKEIFWLRGNLLTEPFITPNLMRAAERLKQVASQDRVAAEISQSIAEKQKSTRPQSKFGLLVPWKKTTVSWLDNTPLEIWGRFTQIETKGADSLTKAPTRFHVAIGLALQSLGVARINVRLGDATAKRSFEFSRLFKRKVKDGPRVGWGLDIGASAVRVICLEQESSEAKIRVKHAAMVPFSSPIFRPEMHEKGNTELKAALEKIITHFSLAEAAVAVNLPSRQLLGRFVNLPPLKDKEIEKLIQQEVKSQFPFLTQEETTWSYWLGETVVSTMEGRPLVVIAGRDSNVKDRLKLVNEAGIKNAILVPSPLALINLVYFEAGDIMTAAMPEPDPNAKPGNSSTEKKTRSVVVALDVGCESATIAIVADDRFFFRTVDCAGDSFCVALAKGLTKTYSETDKLKLRPIECAGMALAYQEMEPVLAHHWERVKQILTDRDPFLDNVKIHHMLLSGGASLLFGYTQPAVK